MWLQFLALMKPVCQVDQSSWGIPVTSFSCAWAKPHQLKFARLLGKYMYMRMAAYMTRHRSVQLKAQIMHME
jgi:hypothetical protein